MGHSTTRADLIYLHSTDARQRIIADVIDLRVRQNLDRFVFLLGGSDGEPLFGP